jgi:large subunit ribosomal protein L25
MSQTHELSAETREAVGTRNCKRLREEGKLPAVLYGHKLGTAHIALDAKEAISHFEAGEKVFELKLEGKSETALLKDLAYDYLGRRIIHVDFERVDLDEKVTVNIPIHLKGDAKGLRAAGALMIHPANDIEIECRVRDMEDSFDVDVSHLEVGDSLHAGELKLPDSWELKSDPETVLAAILVKQEEAEGEEVEVEAGDGEPEVIAEKKDDAEAGESKE